MLSNRPVRWMLAFACGSLIAAGCSTTTDTPQGETGSLSVDLVIADGIVIDTVEWEITGNGMEMGDTINVSAPGSTASVEVFGLPPGTTDYTVTLTAESADEQVACRGSADFNVEIGETTDVMVVLNCKLPRRLGAVRVNGEFNICAELIKAVVSPLQTSVGNDIDLLAQAVDQDGDPITFSWEATGGSIADPSADETTYTCEEEGDQIIVISVTDNDLECDMAMWDILVTCVAGDGGTGGTGGAGGETGGGGAGGETGGGGAGGEGGSGGVVDPCEGVDCSDDNECTADECADGVCSNPPVMDGTSCDGGAGTCQAGVCEASDLCEGVDCSDDNECTADLCTDGNCDNPPVMDGTSCDGGAGTCQAGVCEASDLCEGVDCSDDNECTSDLCADGVCSNPPVMDDTMCDSNMGTCQSGVCVPNDPCEGLDCSDGNECTADACADGVCSNPNLDADVMCDQDGGKVCDGAGTCVECNSNNQCDIEFNETCVDNECLAGCTAPAPVDAIGIPMACRNSFNQAASTFPIDLTNVNTNGDCIEAGQAVDFIIDPVIALDTAFLQAAAQTLCDLGTFLTEADVTSAQVSIDAIAGANCTPELAILSPVPQTLQLDITLEGTCGSGGVVTVNSGISVPLPQTSLSCTAGAAGEEVQLCSTGEVPLEISLTVPAPPPAYQETYVGVAVGGGAIKVGFACNTSSTTNPAPGQENEIGCVLANPTPSTPSGQSCAEAVGDGNVGETPFPTSDCNTEEGPPTEPQMCDLFGSLVPCSGTCDTVPVGVDPSGVCATFTVE